MSKNTGQSTSIMESRTITGLKGLAVIGSVLVYLLIVVYAEYHFFNLISGFVPGGMQVVGMIAVAASGITAILLPVAIHFWFRSGLQLIVGFIFYGIHFLMMFANLILDSSLQGTAIADTPDWIVTVYAPYILPGYIAFYALAWSILWFVDSNSQRIDKRREVEQIEEDGRLDRQISLANFRSNALTAAFNSQAAQETVNRLIATQAPALLAQELGLSVEELGPTQDFEFWMRPADQGNQQPPQPNNKNIVAAAGSPAPTTRPRDDYFTELEQYNNGYHVIPVRRDGSFDIFPRVAHRAVYKTMREIHSDWNIHQRGSDYQDVIIVYADTGIPVGKNRSLGIKYGWNPLEHGYTSASGNGVETQDNPLSAPAQ